MSLIQPDDIALAHKVIAKYTEDDGTLLDKPSTRLARALLLRYEEVVQLRKDCEMWQGAAAVMASKRDSVYAELVALRSSRSEA